MYITRTGPGNDDSIIFSSEGLELARYDYKSYEKSNLSNPITVSILGDYIHLAKPLETSIFNEAIKKRIISKLVKITNNVVNDN